MSKSNGSYKTTDSVRTLDQNGDLAKSLNTLRTVPGHPNPFVISQRTANERESRPATPLVIEQSPSQ